MNIDMEQPPGLENLYHSSHADLLLNSLARLTGIHPAPNGLFGEERAKWLFESAPFAIVSHGIEADPIFNYANITAMSVFEMKWEEFTVLPSRLSAEPLHRVERARLMATVAERGYISNYGGVRISKNGHRFRIENALVWNLLLEDGSIAGQAAMFASWSDL